MSITLTFSVVSNFRIDTEERLLRLRDSFYSFSSSHIDKWIINARGPLADDALSFLKSELGDKLCPYKIESGQGWFADTRQLISEIETPYLLYWVEDQICLCGPDKLRIVIEEMETSGTEYMGYSWFGLGTFSQEFKNLDKEDHSTISVVNYGPSEHKKRLSNSVRLIGARSYIISLPGIFSKPRFATLLEDRKFFFRRYPKHTPFDFERSADDTNVLPIKYGVPKFELFAAIDDDNCVPGSSLISRGLYENRMSRAELLKVRDNKVRPKRFRKLRNLLKKIWLIRKTYKLLVRISYHF